MLHLDDDGNHSRMGCGKAILGACNNLRTFNGRWPAAIIQSCNRPDKEPMNILVQNGELRVDGSAGERSEKGLLISHLFGPGFFLTPIPASLSCRAQPASLGHARAMPPSHLLTIAAAAAASSLALSARAHNWLDNPSGRAGGGLSKTAPCRARASDKLHHLMVGPGQTFNIQWSAGHGGDTYFALVAR